MKFVDRIKEQAVLQTTLESNASSFIVIYGRHKPVIEIRTKETWKINSHQKSVEGWRHLL